MGPIFNASFLAVMKIFLVAAAGAWLTRHGVMTRELRRGLSRIVLLVMLPCLLVSKLSASIDLANLVSWSVLPAAALLYTSVGMFLGEAAQRLSGTPPHLRRIVRAATAFGNSGYLPFPLVVSIAATVPMFRDDPGAADRGIAYISVYLVCYTPVLWGLCFPYLAHEPLGHLKWRQLLSPPVLSVAAGIVLGVVSPLRALFVAADAPFRVILDAAELAGAGVIPCALLILGANLADADAHKETLGLRAVAAVGVGRFLILPAVACGLVVLLRRWQLIPADPMFALVLLIEASTPAATNLIVMCQVHHRGEGAMSNLLFWNYMIAIPALTVLIAVFLGLVGNT